MVAGWGFWGVTFALLLLPCIYAAAQVGYESAHWIVPVSIGSIVAMISSGFLSWIVNSTLQLFNAWRKKKRQSKKKKKKKKSKRK